MKELQRLAAKSFQEFAKQNNSNAKWSYLSKPRQEAWKIELINKLIFCVGWLQPKLDTEVNMVVMTSFEKGVYEGRMQEQRNTRIKLDFLKEQLVKALDEIN